MEIIGKFRNFVFPQQISTCSRASSNIPEQFEQLQILKKEKRKKQLANTWMKLQLNSTLSRKPLETVCRDRAGRNGRGELVTRVSRVRWTISFREFSRASARSIRGAMTRALANARGNTTRVLSPVRDFHSPFSRPLITVALAVPVHHVRDDSPLPPLDLPTRISVAPLKNGPVSPCIVAPFHFNFHSLDLKYTPFWKYFFVSF